MFWDELSLLHPILLEGARARGPFCKKKEEDRKIGVDALLREFSVRVSAFSI